MYIWMVWCETNPRVLGKGLELISVNGARFEINRRLFVDHAGDAALVANSEEMCKLVSEFGECAKEEICLCR